MKRIAGGFLALALGVPGASASLNVNEDPSAEQALLTWSDPAAWQAGLVYQRVSRPVALDAEKRDLRGNIADGMIGFAPRPWLLFYGQLGASEAWLAGAQRDKPGFDAGGLLGARLNLWQIYEGVQKTSWRVTLQLAGHWAYRTTADEGSGDVRWSEAQVALPLDYHLTFARTYRNEYSGEFNSFHLYAGPVFSRLDGTWRQSGRERDFEAVDEIGVVGGGELWLLENVAFGARVEWFDGTSGQLTVRYRF